MLHVKVMKTYFLASYPTKLMKQQQSRGGVLMLSIVFINRTLCDTTHDDIRRNM